MTAQQLIDSIKETFLHQNTFAMQKLVPEFSIEGKFIGDYFNYIIFESLGEKPPRIYHTASPYDVISKKAPDQALVFYDGKLELNVSFTEYVDMRTGIMDALLLQSLGIESLQEKRIIFFGTGKISRWSLRYLKEIYPELNTLDVVNASGSVESFSQFASELDVTATQVTSPDISLYDVIIMHTSTDTSILTIDDVTKIKKGAIITSYRTTSPSGELESVFFNSSQANVIVDWESSLSFVVDLKGAQEKGALKKDEVMYLEDIFRGTLPSNDKAYTVFRSTGTPMQNVAILKLIMQEKAEA